MIGRRRTVQTPATVLAAIDAHERRAADLWDDPEHAAHAMLPARRAVEALAEPAVAAHLDAEDWAWIRWLVLFDNGSGLRLCRILSAYHRATQ